MKHEDQPDIPYTVQQIADEFGVTRPTIYRHLSNVPNQPKEPS